MVRDIKYRRDLHELMQVDGNAAEIGVAEGNFSIEVLGWPIQFPTVYLVGRWEQIPGQKGDGGATQNWHDQNLQQVRHKLTTLDYWRRVTLLRGGSVDMARMVKDGSLAFCYIDCDHAFASCMADVGAWWPKLREGGVLAFHDYLNLDYGVNAAVRVLFTGFSPTLVRREVHEIPENKAEDAGAWVRK